MNVKQLRQVLEQVLGYFDYQTLNGVVTRTPSSSAPGFYFQGDAQVGPAFYVQGRQRVPSNWDVRGLEAVLVEKPRTRQWGNLRTQHWTLYLQQYDTSKGVSEYELMVQRHFGKNAQSTYWRKEDEDLSDRVMLTIKTEDYDLPYYPTDAPVGRVPSPVENSPFLSYFDQ